MRKSSKLLAVLLTLCLLFGAITAIFASADETATPTLNVGDAQGTSYTTTDAASNVLREQATNDSNLYLTNFEYMVIDLDFNLVPGTTAPSGFNFDTCFMIDGAAKITPRLYVVEKDGSYYMSFSNSNADLNENAKVSNTSGLYDHLTYVFKIDNSTAGKCTLTPSFYVNGTFIAKGTAKTFDVSASICLYRPANKATWNGAKFSDKNYVINYYKPGTDNTVALEKALENNAPLYRFEGYNSKLGVVYNANYVTPDAATNYVTVNGTKHTLVGKAMDAIATWTGADNALTVSGRDFCATIPDGVTSFKVTKVGGASFSYNASAQYIETTDGDTTTYTLPSTDNVYVTINGGDKITTVAAAKEAIAAIPNDATIVVVGMELTDVTIPEGVTKFTVTCDEASNFTFASTFPTWKYAKVGDTYTKVIDGQIWANLSLFSDRHQFKIYIPQPENGTLSGAGYYRTATGSNTDTNSQFDNFTYNGVDYLVLYWNVRMDMNGKTAYAELNYTDENGNEATLLSRFEAAFDVPTYVEKVAETYDCGSEEAQLAKAIAEFKVEVLKLFKSNIKLGDYADKDDPQAEYDKAVEKAQNLINAYDPVFAHYEAHAGCKCSEVVPEDNDYIKVGAKHPDLKMPEGVSVTYGIGTQYFFMYVNGTAGDIVTVSYIAAGNVAVTKRGTIGSTSGHASFSLIGAADIDNEFTITITRPGAEGEEATVVGSFSYSLADYDVESNEDVKNVVNALKKYAIAAENYKKYPKGTTPEDTLN